MLCSLAAKPRFHECLLGTFRNSADVPSGWGLPCRPIAQYAIQDPSPHAWAYGIVSLLVAPMSRLVSSNHATELVKNKVPRMLTVQSGVRRNIIGLDI